MCRIQIVLGDFGICEDDVSFYNLDGGELNLEIISCY